MKKRSNELKTRSVNQLLEIDEGVPWNQKKWSMVALAKGWAKNSIIGTFLNDACITGRRVKVWRHKPSTGHDEKEEGLEANN